MNIAILGTGYVGLVTGASFASTGNKVTCVDINKEKIELLNRNQIPIFEPGLEDVIKSAVKEKCLFFSSNIRKSIKENDIIFIAVGTPMNKDGSSNLNYIHSASKDIGKYINKEKIIVTKSTIPVGTTANIKRTIIEEIEKRNKEINFNIANNPEFLKEGKAIEDFMSPDRIIVGIEDEKMKKIFKLLYKPFSLNHKKLIFMDIRSSELTKYASNAMLATKISFINEMAIIAEKVGADISCVREGIGSDSRIGYNFIYPSVGYGGSCFPKDLRAILNFSNKRGYNPKILEAVNLLNFKQKKYFLDKIFKKFLKNDSLNGLQFGIWGLSFKPGTDDMRESSSIYIVEEIIKCGGSVKVYDPKAMDNAKNIYFKNVENITYCNNKYDALDNSSALILLTEWTDFRSPDFKLIKEMLSDAVIFDGRNQYNKNDLRKLGFEYYNIGYSSN